VGTVLISLRLLAMLVALFFWIRSCECDFLAMEKVAPCKRRRRRIRYRWMDVDDINGALHGWKKSLYI